MKRCFWLAGAALAFVAPAFAQQPAAPVMQGMAACRAELATVCRGLEAGGGKRLACLEQNRPNLSPACAATVQQRVDERAERRALKGAPAAPKSAQPPAAASGTPIPPPVAGAAPPKAAQAGPAPIPPPPGAAPKAATPASPPATGPAPIAAAPRGNPLRDCRQDMQALCATVPPGGGARVACLRQNNDRLSPPCAQALTAFDAQKEQTKVANRQACQADAQRLCRGQRGPDRQACLTQNQAQLSPACAEQVARRAARAAALPAPAPAAGTPPAAPSTPKN